MKYYVGIIEGANTENEYLVTMSEKTQYENDGIFSKEIDDETWDTLAQLGFEFRDDDTSVCLLEAPSGMTAEEAIAELEDNGFIFSADFNDDAENLFNLEGYSGDEEEDNNIL